jgi:hypothetical protein
MVTIVLMEVYLLRNPQQIKTTGERKKKSKLTEHGLRGWSWDL